MQSSQSLQNIVMPVATGTPSTLSRSQSEAAAFDYPLSPQEPAPSLPAVVMPEGLVSLSADLMQAIQAGDMNSAKHAVQQLARLNANLDIMPKTEQPQHMTKLKIHFEDIDKNLGHVIMELPQNISIRQLKQKMLCEYEFPPEIQLWIMKRRIVQDDERLATIGLRPGETHDVYLYLASKETVGMTPEMYQSKYASFWAESSAQEDPEDEGDISIIQEEELSFSEACAEPPFEPAAAATAEMRTAPPFEQATAAAAEMLNSPAHIEQETPGWDCPACTFKNTPTRPGCEMCGQDRPEDYQVPDNVELPDAEKLRLEKEAAEGERLRQMERAQEEQRADQRMRALLAMHDAEERDLVATVSPFDCPICFIDIDVGEGVVLRDCLHMFCRDCLTDYIRLNEDAHIRCPYQGTYTCDIPLQEREIKAIVGPEVFNKYLARGLQQAEGAMQNTFHCKTPDCVGWCVYEDEVNFFMCPVCGKNNCLTCRAFHDGMNCKQYQEDIKVKAANDENARATHNAIQEMLRTGVAMNCPGCGVIVQKKEGCDWLKCSCCQIEICWVTKKPRRGPNGCHCRENGAACHPNCGNCH